MLCNLMKVNPKFPQQPCVFGCDRCKINKKFQPFINVSGILILILSKMFRERQIIVFKINIVSVIKDNFTASCNTIIE